LSFFFLQFLCFNLQFNKLPGADRQLHVKFVVYCHVQPLAATNRVTEQLSWLTVESFICLVK
jgi:hypothetical protein